MLFSRAGFRFSPGPSLPTVPSGIQFLACHSRVAVAKLQLHPYLYLTNAPLHHHLPPPHLHPTLYQTSISPPPCFLFCCFLGTCFCSPLALLLDSYPSSVVPKC